MIERARYDDNVLDRLNNSLFSIRIQCTHCVFIPGEVVQITVQMRLYGKSLEHTFTGYLPICKFTEHYTQRLDRVHVRDIMEDLIQVKLLAWLNSARAIMEGKQGIIAIDLASFLETDIMRCLEESIQEIAAATNVVFVIHTPAAIKPPPLWRGYLDRIGMTEAEWLEGL